MLGGGSQVMQAYERSPVPQPGEEFEFCPDASLQPVHYRRGRASEGLVGQYVHRAAVAAAEAEAGEGLGSWTVAALCRSLSLDNILMLLTGLLDCLTVTCASLRELWLSQELLSFLLNDQRCLLC